MIRRWLFGAFCLVALTGCWDMGEGEKVGVIVGLRHQGVFCRTWEAKLIRGALQGGSGVIATAFDFTIENNDALVAKVQEAMDKGYEVKVRYRTEFNTFCRSDSNGHFLLDIKPVVP